MTSVYYAQKLKSSTAVTRSSISKLETEVAMLQKAKTGAQATLTHPGEAAKFDAAVSALLVAIMKERLDTGITVASVLPAKSVLASSATSFDMLADKLDGTPLKSARFNVRGNYQTYEGLLEYIGKLRKMSVAVVYLKIDATAFEMGLRAYGI